MSGSKSLLLVALAFAGACSDGDRAPPAQKKEALRFKGPKRIANDFARALELEVENVCTEPGGRSCTEVHAIALGSAAPYTANVYRPADTVGTTAPIAVDRIALSACAQRVDRDLADPAHAVIFREGACGIERLYRGALQRMPSAEEVALLEGLAPEEPDPRARCVAICFAVLSSEESLFY